MDDNTSYQIDKSELCVQKMNFVIINRRPKFLTKNQEAAKTEIEKQLFRVFEKYADNS